MREIKFRAWDNKNKEFVCAVPSLEILLDDPDAAVSHHDYDVEEAVYFCPNDPLGPTFKGRIEYEQFTGLTDINGKEIYEGDIVKYRLGKKEYFDKVRWENNGWRTISWFGSSEPLCASIMIVVGNIRENPELLKSHE